MTTPWNTDWTVHLYDQYGRECVGYDPQPLDGFIEDVWVDGWDVVLTAHPMRFFFVGPLENDRRVVAYGARSGDMGLGVNFLDKPVHPTAYGDVLSLTLTLAIPTSHWAARTLREQRHAA